MVLTVGGGMDYSTPLFDHHLAIRVFQADFQYTHEDFANSQRGNFNVARLSAGLVYHIGSIAPPAPVTLSCSASPNSVFPGDPVTVTASAGSLDPKLNALYSISGAGVNATTATATVATGALAPGSYTVKCGVKEGKPGKEGLKPWEVADASANFTVKAFEPPTVSCSANPTTIKPGETATVTAMGMSPQNRPLTYNYSSTSGSVSGSGTTATFNSAGAPTGAAGITCTVSDDKNQTATGSTSVTIMAPYVAPIPHTETLCSIGFDKDKKRPSRVDNEAKACLDQVAMDLQRQADAKAVVVGSSDAKEKDATAKEAKRALKNKHVKVVDMAAERAVNAKEYLVTDKGIDATRVSVATSAADGQKVEDYLVPSGATFSADVTGTTAVDETTVKPEVRKPLAEKHHAKKAAAKKQ
jgi:outer membrane protein OmpA-like peptidoglycan-associated protein